MTDITNKATSREPRDAGVKKPYKTPAFRFESVFEVAALSCGKISATTDACRASRKAS
jgi:hypothetical protein